MNIKMGAEQSISKLPNGFNGAGASPQPDVKDENIPPARPFPPPMSTVDVLAQFQNLKTWTCIGEDDSLMVGASSSLKRKAEDLVENFQEDDGPRTASLVAKTNGFNNSQYDQHNHTLQSSTAYAQGGRKKKRLFLSRQALDVVEGAQNGIIDGMPKDYSNDSKTARAHLSPRLGTVRDKTYTPDADSEIGDSRKNRHLNIFDDDESDDEGYYTNPSFSSASGSPKNAEDEDQVVRTLAKLHQRSATRAQDECEVESDTPSPQEQLAADARSREEAAGAERSRLLRERKLSGDISGVFGGRLPANDRPFFNSEVQQQPCPTQDFSPTPSGARHEPSDGSTKHLHYTSYDAARPVGSDPKLEVRKPSSFRDSAIHIGLDREPDHNFDYDIEHDFDLVKRHVEEQSPYRATPNGSAIRDPPAHYNASDPNPASRAATNQWRTQTRHRESGLISLGTNIAKGNVDAEARLRALTQQTKSSRQVHKPLPLPEYSHAIPQRFYGLESGPVLKSALKAPLRQLGARATTFDSSSNGYDSPKFGQQRRAAVDIVAHQASDDESDNGSSAIALKALPDIDVEDNSQVAEEHDRLKDQKRDLDNVKDLYWQVASIYALDDLSSKEKDELREVRKYVNAVLVDQKPATVWRRRAQDVKSNMKRRYEKLLFENDPATKSAIKKCFTILLKENKIAILNQLLAQNEDRADELKARRFEFKEQRKNRSWDRKKVRFAERQPKQQKITKAQQEQEHAEELQRTLDRMPGGCYNLPTSSRPSNGSLRTAEYQGSAYAEPQSESEISEETEGEDNYPGAGVRPSEALDFMGRERHQIPAPEELVIVGEEEDEMQEIHRLDEERQREQAEQERLEKDGLDECTDRPPVVYSSQGPDRDLLRQMRQKDRERDITHPFDDLDEISDDSSVPTGIVQKFRYNVKVAARGSALYAEGTEYGLTRTTDEARAQAHVRDVIMSIVDENSPSLGRNYDLKTITRGGLYEQTLVMGENDEVSARVWVEREIVNVDLNRIAANKAQKCSLAKERLVYKVSITTTSEPITNSTAGPQAPSRPAQEEEDDLFGRSRSPTPTPMPTPPPPVTTETRYFTLPSLANRYAKDAYMSWYSQFDPSFPSALRAFPRNKVTIGYSGFLGHKSTALDEELKVLGDEGCWKNSEEVVYDGKRENWDGKVEEVVVEGPGN